MSLRTLSAALRTRGLIAAALAWSQPPTAPAPRTFPDPLPLASAPSQYWKGNLHTHSLWSDGDDFPEMIADWYKTHNYSFLMLSDHNIIADGEKWIPSESTAARKLATEKYAKRFGENWLERREEKGVKQVKLKPLREFKPMLEDAGKFMLIPGEEVTHAHNKRPIHINAVNLRDVLLPVDGKTAEESIQINMRNIAAAQSKAKWIGLSFLNHPNFKWGVKCEDFMGVEEVKFFEVFNGHPGVDNYGDKTHAGTERRPDGSFIVNGNQHCATAHIFYGTGAHLVATPTETDLEGASRLLLPFDQLTMYVGFDGFNLMPHATALGLAVMHRARQAAAKDRLARPPAID